LSQLNTNRVHLLRHFRLFDLHDLYATRHARDHGEEVPRGQQIPVLPTGSGAFPVMAKHEMVQIVNGRLQILDVSAHLRAHTVPVMKKSGNEISICIRKVVLYEITVF